MLENTIKTIREKSKNEDWNKWADNWLVSSDINRKVPREIGKMTLAEYEKSKTPLNEAIALVTRAAWLRNKGCSGVEEANKVRQEMNQMCDRAINLLS